MVRLSQKQLSIPLTWLWRIHAQQYELRLQINFSIERHQAVEANELAHYGCTGWFSVAGPGRTCGVACDGDRGGLGSVLDILRSGEEYGVWERDVLESRCKKSDKSEFQCGAVHLSKCIMIIAK